MVKLIGGIGLFCLMATVAAGAVVTLTDQNSTASFDMSGVGMNGWTVNGANQLTEQSFWYRVGSTGGAQRVPLSNYTYDIATPNTLSALYVGSGFQIEMSWTLLGSAPGNVESDIAETIRITNTSSSILDFHFWQYVDLNLLNTPFDTSVAVGGGYTAVQDDGTLAVSETADVPKASRYEADYQPIVFGHVQGGLLSNNSSQVNGDLAWAFQWDRQLSAGASLIISKDKHLSIVPEPSTLALLLVGAVGLLAYASRKRS
jgi:hypothetical protein